MVTNRNELLDAAGIDRILTRIAHEIFERNKGGDKLVLVGISNGGDYMAVLLQHKLQDITSCKVPIGTVDIAMHRDDIASRRKVVVGKTEMNFSVNDCQVILIDDVLFTGRTVRAAIDAIFELGRPRNIQVAVLIDRGHRELPIRPDYVGRSLPTSRAEDIEVKYGDDRVPQTVALVRMAELSEACA
ncbi:bifunctional pyr operon transcriptional regulator/uracil phosphoribosyltransferase PyrR [Geomonas subterranea]|uniref:Bifunctional protein PyrR n=1 Tax=Geomonas subterranea TaxID=2847989 RepID=A0ABX8LT22_9BACT|nr:bifunctional pyr operon transcriptional regulator/uracil phosphoribosyltransferase PyrR [Geomonas subterranea]QXE92640.1 bifunctional pyr operon transcriptional regulator/uracil phosphoribosyltransferase PyrR [Geomonas subterranea]QXM09261.1 bifunctional pyr operon transcriptional regulator/uracil phosphoribosyltransferase PyrR [Geomonas subterranea]